ncbi:MAG TPA: TIGR02206 family membrane protein [Miltoncostaeaceae bacterium]|nr:TIGR02206 family membrane protein [Miltoncostaeaceae bacterium]
MDAFSAEHLVVLAATAAAAAGAGLLARRDGAGARTLLGARALAVLLVLNEVVFHAVHWADRGFSARTDLPLQLTDAATIAAVIALWWGSPLAFELTWFWAGSASAQALLTPDLRQSFPDYRWWWFVIAHSGVIVAAVLMAWGMRRTPRPGAVPRAYAWSLAVTALAATGCLLFDGNYMYLRRTPAGGSLLDLMGPWPWYIASAAALALALFWLLDRPFDGRRRRARG